MKIIETTQAPAAVGPYSQAVAVNGFFFFSGQIALRPEGEFLDEDIQTQTAQVFENIKALLEASGLRKQEVIKATVFLSDLNNFETVNQLYAEFFGNHRPARSCVEVSRLPKNAKIEIEIVGYKAADL